MDEKIKAAVDAIVRDLSDRSGLGGEWDSIDADIQYEIREEWGDLIRGALGI